MPRSFLVKTHLGHRAPDYGRLETRREASGARSACGRPAAPVPAPHGEAPSAPGRPPAAAAVARLSPPLPRRQEAPGASGPEPADASRTGPRAGGTPSLPLRPSLNHLNLPPPPPPPPRWPPVLGPGGDAAPDKHRGGEGTPRVPGGCGCVHCHGPHRPPSGLAQPPRLHRPPPAGRTFTCRHCAKVYASLGALKMHIRTHTLPCICGVCGKAFSRPWLLQGHARTHTGEKPYACPHCSRAFADRSNLRAHLQTHSGTKKYQCKGCSKTFSRMSLLARHEEASCCPGP